MPKDSKLGSIIPDTIFKFKEASYFLQRMVETYHQPEAFHFNLNATIQALRNITFILQSELSENSKFAQWYLSQQTRMRENALLRRFVDARNIVVKKKSLETRSRASAGLFRYRRPKIWLERELCPFISNEKILKHAQEFFIGFMLDEAHSAIGEQIGVRREWIAVEIGENEVVAECNQVLDYFGTLLVELAGELGFSFVWKSGPLKEMEIVQVLLESDLDPSLPKKWGWED